MSVPFYIHSLEANQASVTFKQTHGKAEIQANPWKNVLIGTIQSCDLLGCPLHTAGDTEWAHWWYCRTDSMRRGVAMKSELPSPHFPQRLLHMDSTYQANLHTLLTSLKGVSHYNEGKKKWREEERGRKTYGKLSHIPSYASLVATISLHRGGPQWKHGQFHLGTFHG